MSAISSTSLVSNTICEAEIPAVNGLNRDKMLINEDILGIIFSFGDKISLTEQALVNRQWNRVISSCLKNGLNLQLLKADFYRAQEILIAKTNLDKRHRVALGNDLPFGETLSFLVLNLCEDCGYMTEEACRALKEPEKMTMEVLDNGLEKFAESLYFHFMSKAYEKRLRSLKWKALEAERSRQFFFRHHQHNFQWRAKAFERSYHVFSLLHQDNIRCANQLVFFMSIIGFNLDKNLVIEELKKNVQKLFDVCSGWIPNQVALVENQEISEQQKMVEINRLRVATLIANKIPIPEVKDLALARIAHAYATLGKFSKSIEILQEVNCLDSDAEKEVGAVALKLIEAGDYGKGIKILKKLKDFLPSYCEQACKSLINKKQYLLAIEVSHLISVTLNNVFCVYVNACNELKKNLIGDLFLAGDYSQLETILKAEGCFINEHIVIAPDNVRLEWLDRFLSWLALAQETVQGHKLVTFLRSITSIPLRSFFCSKIVASISLAPGRALEVENIADMIEDPQKKERRLQYILEPLEEFFANKDKEDFLKFLKQIKSSYIKNHFFPSAVLHFLRKDDLIQAEEIANMIEDPNEKEKSFKVIVSVGKCTLLKAINSDLMEILKQIKTPSLKNDLLVALVELLVSFKDKVKAEEIANMIEGPIKGQTSLESIDPSLKKTLPVESTSTPQPTEKVISQASVPTVTPNPTSNPVISAIAMSRITYAKTSLAKLWHQSFSFKLLSVASCGLIPLIVFLFKFVFNKPQV